MLFIYHTASVSVRMEPFA